jgi:hypothetical protein
MEELDYLHTLLRKFEQDINADKTLNVHGENKFNKQFSFLLRDWHYLKVIVQRLETGDTENTIQLAVDLKSLYVFGRVFSESVLYISSLFINGATKDQWGKIGGLVKTMEEKLESQDVEVKKFWREVGGSIQVLNKAFKYRNEVLHGKDGNTEWTFAWPGKSNLDHVYIDNVPWPEDRDKKEALRSLNARNLVQVLANEIPKILDYLTRVKN